MLKNYKKIISGSLIAFFVAFLFLFSSHFHAQNQGSEKNNCSLCQISHSISKLTFNQSSLQISNHQCVSSNVETPPFLIYSSNSHFVSPIRGPPVI